MTPRKMTPYQAVAGRRTGSRTFCQAALTLRITFRRADGFPAVGPGNPVSVVIAAGATVLVSAAAALDQ
jgi:hypothetical protein